MSCDPSSDPFMSHLFPCGCGATCTLEIPSCHGQVSPAYYGDLADNHANEHLCCYHREALAEAKTFLKKP